VIFLDIISDRRKDNIIIQSVATQSDPKELRKRLFSETDHPERLDVNSFENFKRSLAKGSHLGVK